MVRVFTVITLCMGCNILYGQKVNYSCKHCEYFSFWESDLTKHMEGIHSQTKMSDG